MVILADFLCFTSAFEKSMCIFLDLDNHLNGEEALGIFPEGINYIGVFEVKSAGASASLGSYYVCVRCDGSVCN